jgi:MFS family permease
MMFGALILPPLLAKCVGRRAIISISGMLCFLGCVVVVWIAGPALSINLYYIGRFVTGFGCGSACMALPMYNSEVATLGIRGTTGSLFQFMVVFGGCLATVMLGFVDWGQGFMIPGYFGVVVSLAVWVCPESPRYLMGKGQKDAATVALRRIRAGDVTEEIEFIEKCLHEEQLAGKVGYLELFTTPGLRYRLFVACYLQAAQQMTGVNALIGFATEIFQASGFAVDEIDVVPGGPAFLWQMVQLVGIVIGLALIDSPFGGRKSQLLVASFLTAPSLLTMAIARFTNSPGWITAAMTFVFGFGFQLAWGIVPWLYPAELFQLKERERALSISTFCGFFLNFLVVLFTKQLLNFSPGCTFLVFGVLNVSNIIFIMVCVKETKGKTLEEIPAMFDNPNGADSKGAPLTASP